MTLIRVFIVLSHLNLEKSKEKFSPAFGGDRRSPSQMNTVVSNKEKELSQEEFASLYSILTPVIQDDSKERKLRFQLIFNEPQSQLIEMCCKILQSGGKTCDISYYGKEKLLKFMTGNIIYEQIHEEKTSEDPWEIREIWTNSMLSSASTRDSYVETDWINTKLIIFRQVFNSNSIFSAFIELIPS
jgi:hypothetical protein